MNESWEATALRCFRREEERRREGKKARKLQAARKLSDSGNADSAEDVGCVWTLAKFAGLWLFFGLMLGIGLGLLATSATLILVRVLPPRLRISGRLKAYRAGEPETVLNVYRFAAKELRNTIKIHRARTLGARSEWAEARKALAEASDDADRSLAYWRNRLRNDPGDQVVARQLKRATELDRKLGSALGKLDARADVLRKFYNECEARVSVMDRYNRDLEEIRRLDELSGAADLVVADAEATLTGIGASFLRECQKMGEVLGDFERLQLGTLAGEVPLDDIEVLADRINEASESKYATVEKLSRAMEDFAEPIGR